MRVFRAISLVAVVALSMTLGYWAGRTALSPPTDPLDHAPESTTYLVETGSVGKALTFTASATWDLLAAGHNSAAGVVTSVAVDSGQTVDAGDVLYTVDLRPVVIAEGAIPVFRSMKQGDSGPDVGQLQNLLTTMGFYTGELDGRFGSSTATSVREWQKSTGFEENGEVLASDLIFVPMLPVRVVLADTVQIGLRLAGGEQAIQLVPRAPDFAIPLTTEQVDLVPLSADVRIFYSEGAWTGRITTAIEAPETGELTLGVEAPQGGPVCGSDCADWVSLAGKTDFRVDVVVIPETRGPIVPVAAIQTDPGGQTFIELGDGGLAEIEIIVSASGLAVVEGIRPGTEIILPVGQP